MVGLGLLLAASHKPHRGPAHPGSCGANLQKVKGIHRAQANDSGQVGALLREGGQAKRPKQVGQLRYARVAREGIRVAVVCENYPDTQIPKEDFMDIRRAIGRIVDDLPREVFTPRLDDSYRAKGAAIIVCRDEPTKDWLADRVPNLLTGKGSRPKLVGLDTLPTYRMVVA